MRLKKRLGGPGPCRSKIPHLGRSGESWLGVPLGCHLDGQRHRLPRVCEFPRILGTECFECFCGVKVLGITVERKPAVPCCAKWASTEARRGWRGGVGLGLSAGTRQNIPNQMFLRLASWTADQDETYCSEPEGAKKIYMPKGAEGAAGLASTVLEANGFRGPREVAEGYRQTHSAVGVEGQSKVRWNNRWWEGRSLSWIDLMTTEGVRYPSITTAY